VIVRRRRLPAHLERPFAAFRRVLAEIEPAKGALTDAMPTTRLPGRPLADALLGFEGRLGRALELMPGWNCDELPDVWGRCDAALREALGRARRLRERAPELGGFEGLIWAVDELLEPLGSFEEAADRFRDLRTRAP
jgi:hypothetical protein